MKIRDRKIAGDEPCYIIAELSANHHQNYDEAVEMIQSAHRCGADAIKLQTYTPDTMTIQSTAPEFQLTGTIWEGKTLYDIYSEAYTPWEWTEGLKAEAEKLGMALFSTPFDSTAVDFLEQLDMPAYKVASFELVDLPLIKKVAACGKPMIMSTGMASLGEIEEAVSAARNGGCDQLALLKCTSSYPSPPEAMNLNTIPHLGSSFDVVAGLSDHTLGIVAPVVAVSLGARIIEKHFTLDRSQAGPDAAFSLEPSEFKQMVEAIRTAEVALGQIHYGGVSEETATSTFRRSLYAVEDIQPGEALTASNVRSIRPGGGLPPKYYDQAIGKKARAFIKTGTPLNWDLITE